MKNKILQELQFSYTPYSPLWNDWIKSTSCFLNEHDIYLINIHRENGFRVNHEHMLMYYTKSSEIETVIGKLKLNYSTYQDWVIRKFLCTIGFLAFSSDSKIPGNKGDFILAKSMQNLLRNFWVNTFQQLMDTYNDDDFKGEILFHHVLDFNFKLLQQYTAC